MGMNYLVCQKNLVSFLSAVYDSYYEKSSNTDSFNITADPNALSMLDTSNYIEEDVEKAKKVRAGIIKKGGTTTYNDIVTAYRSGNNNKEQIILEYLRLFFKNGNHVKTMFDNKSVVAFNDLINKVGFETHRLTGFIRLQEMSNGVFYAYFSSDNDVLELVMPDFVKRFNTMRFILHDYKRCKMGFFDGNKVHYSVAPEKVEIELSEKETFFQSIWKQYHQTVTIKDRENPRLQSAFLPKKYRHFMSEF